MFAGLPSKDGKDRQRANAGKRAKELHAIQEKQELLAQLSECLAHVQQ